MNIIMLTTEAKITQLIHAIANTQDASPQQKRYFNRLLIETDKFYYIYKNYRFSASDVDDAKNLTRIAICGLDRSNATNAKLIRNLVKFPYSYLVNRYATLVKVIFNRKLCDIHRKNHAHLSLDAKINFQSEETFINVLADSYSTGLDKLIESQEEEFVNKLIHYINEDPDDVLKKCHPKGYPQCNAQVLIKERFLQDTSKKWQELSVELNTSVGTMTGRFFNPKCLPLLRQIARKFNVC